MMLLVELQARPECCEELMALLEALTEIAATEAGVLVYAVNRSQDTPTHFVLYELYRSRAEWEAHLQLTGVKQALARFPELLTEEPKLLFGEGLQRVAKST
ncbi:putative quinol monooxygenase [uncultured Dechloromonas sp.]|uniref:putative quinol monooxygenase n=1 Tax=uncultured Dechloromonas sp. TaxID=171719 RepID=UPI0025F5D63C|nr:putative quinol monooxygenase [uncultured Dechloromonas sp.]